MKTVTEEQLDDTVEHLVSTFDVEQIYLYGSHAYGTPHSDSDVDILVVVRESDVPPHKRARMAYHALGEVLRPAEIIVETEEEFSRRSQWISTIEKTVKEKGRVLYDRTGSRDAGMAG